MTSKHSSRLWIKIVKKYDDMIDIEEQNNT